MANPGRLDVDWLIVQADFEAGQLSSRAIAAKHRISHEAVRQRASKGSWSRSLAGAVHRSRNAMLNAESHKAANRRIMAISALPEALVAEAVHTAAITQVEVIREHQASIRKDRRRLDHLTRQFDNLMAEGGTGDIKQLSAFAVLFERLVRCQERLVRLERIAYGLEQDQVRSCSPSSRLTDEQREALFSAIAARTRHAAQQTRPQPTAAS